MPSRILYVGQSCTIATDNGTGYVRYLPVQSANCETSQPVEDVLSFGQLGSLGRYQTSVTTCKSSIKSYLPMPTGGGTFGVGDVTGAGSPDVNNIDATLLGALTGNALAGTVSVITVSPNGFTMSGILSSFGVDISNGGFAMADFAFDGVGQPYYAPKSVGNVYLPAGTNPSSFTPVLSSHVSGIYQMGGGQSITGNTASSMKFHLDLPSDQLSCLGGNITGGQVDVAPYFLKVAKPPFKTTISVEGTAIDVPVGTGAAGNTYVIGTLGINLPKAITTSHSFNNAVGNVGATYNYTVEDTSVVFSDIVNSYPY
jgi:hypothetical protein